MLHLKSGVHFQEVKTVAGLVRARHDQFDRAGAEIADRAGERDALLAHLLAHFRADEGRRRFFDHLLMAALDRTFAFVQIDDIAMLVAQYLDFNVARAFDELLDEDAVVTEAGESLALGRLEALTDILLRVSQAHPLAAAAGRRLHHHRIADLVGNTDGVVGVLNLPHETGDDVDAGLLGELLGLDLVTHGGNRVGGGADEDDALGVERFAEGFALREEAVARMDGIRAGLLACRDNFVGDQVGLGSGRRTDMHGLVRHQDMRRTRIGIGIDRDGLDAHLLGRPHDTARDLATVRDQDFGDWHIVLILALIL